MPGGRRSRAVFFIGVPLTIAIVAATTRTAIAALIVPAVVALILVVRYSWARATFFMLGAFLVFQTSTGLSAPKLAYFAVVALSVLVSLAKLRTLSHDPVLAALRPAYFGGLGIIVWQLFVVLPYSVGVQGVRIENWLRDGATYVLIGCAVIIALDAISTSSRRLARSLVAVVGAVAAYSFASRWIAARGLIDASDPDNNATLLSSLAALTLAVALAFALALVGKRIRWIWLTIGITFVLAVLVTGTRTGVVFGAVLVGVVGARSKERAPVRRVLGGALVGVAAVLATIPITASLFSNADFLTERFASIWTTLQNGVGSDQSGAIRARAYEYCLGVWQDNLLMGRGEGWTFINPTTAAQGADFSVDSPLVYLAKFGIVGCLVLVACLGAVFFPLIRRAAGFAYTVENTAVRGCTVILVALLPFGATLEDKGFSITVALAVLLVGTSLRDQQSSPSHLLAGSDGGEPVLTHPSKSGQQRRAAAPVVPPGRS